MNHDKIKDVINSTLLSSYNVLFEEYKNIEKAKKEVFKLASQCLKEFGAVSDLYETIIHFNKLYDGAEDQNLKSQILKKLETINEAIKIMEERGNTNG